MLRGVCALHSYARARGLGIEADYNLGRAAHELGLLHLAVMYYERTLKAREEAREEEEAARGVGGGCRGGGRGVGDGGDEEMRDVEGRREAEEGSEVVRDGRGWGSRDGRMSRGATPAPASPLPLAPVMTLEERSEVEGLSREAAYNLVHIYRRTGATALARQIMQRYLVF